MEGLVPAAGRGTRLRPLTADRPKALVEVANTPLLTHVLDALEPYVDTYVVVIGYRGDQIKAQYGNQFNDIPIQYVQQSPPAGLADAVRRAEPALTASFLQLNGDNIVRGNLTDVIATHHRTDADATLLVDEVPLPRAQRGGVLEVTGGEITGIVEKPEDPPSRIATTGCFAFSPGIFDACWNIERAESGEFELTDAIQWLIDHDASVESIRLDGWRVNINTPRDIARAKDRL